MNRDECEKLYKSNEKNFNSLKSEVDFILTDIFKNADIKIHIIQSRIKEFESFYEKVNKKECKYPLQGINDIVGFRIVCLFLSDIKKIGDIIKNNFDVISEDNKIDGYDDLSTFGYMSLHFVVKLNHDYNGPRYKDIKDRQFEIQIRTITMDAWANISHYLSYKTENDIPNELKRDFFALSGLFYVSDAHFELFYNASKTSEKDTENRVINKLENTNSSISEDINLYSLKAYLNTKYPDRKNYKDKDFSILITELNNVGIHNISELEDIHKMAWETFLIKEQATPPRGGKFNCIGVVRSLLELTNSQYRLMYNRKILGSYEKEELC